MNYTLLNFPKIISKILPFAFFFSFSYVIAKYELNNELIIFWNFGVNKITFVNLFLIFSVLLLFFQIVLTAFVVPNSQTLARSIVRTAEYNFVDHFIKVKKFNAAVNDLTIYTESKEIPEKYLNSSAKKLKNKRKLKFFKKYLKYPLNDKIDENMIAAIIIPDKDIIPGSMKLKPAYVVFDNYELILKWNRSLRFALAVCTLKDKFKNEI